MQYREIYADLFNVADANPDAFLVHCISADFALGAGIAVEFNNRYNLRSQLLAEYGNTAIERFNTTQDLHKGFCIRTGNIYNLVTKELYFYKPTYITFTNALLDMHNQIINPNSTVHPTKLIMPTIGCGLDRLRWPQVSTIIKDTFKDINIKIIVCRKAKSYNKKGT